MKKMNAKTLMTLLVLLPALLLPLDGITAESFKETKPLPAIDPTLPIHQKKKLHPELSDPVLGDQAAIVEWAWSPQYAKRFNQPVQADGLKDGPLWLIGVKIQRKQNGRFQGYQCNMVGLMDNKLPILTPPGEQYIMPPDYAWFGGMPGMNGLSGSIEYTPGQATWTKNPRNKAEKNLPESGIGAPYLLFSRRIKPAPGLAFFEIKTSCSYFRDPKTHRNEISFPTRIDGKNDVDPRQSAQWESSAVAFVIPDGLMQRIYPYVLDADDWSSCLLRRNGDKADTLTTHALLTKRFGNSCEPQPPVK